ncbi:hypothetical protein C3B44_02825 [Corynebacterium yudongzhengii]|uniref:Uncharacterized protein n=1 Tax=Corynebacterium yudongzhengii TaxID=2080740 RepID=A0A2U1T519_9CORY|nr:hypothetical protein [Corynebacterium yudongzhengii]AWB81419.1 hypothetical protein C3B44_02825 [Corynebacterium yudongzhengii]PWC01083.1 hypothetical protein DF222_09340 [Corynebacterium yudongzhengii]
MNASSRTVPVPLKFGAIIGLIQAGVAFAVAIYLTVMDLTNATTRNLESDAAAANWIGVGTAIFIFILFGTVAAGAISLLRGRGWGRTPLVMMNVLLVPVAVYMAMEGLWPLAVVVGLAALLGLGGVLHPQSSAYAAESYGA